MIFSLISNNNDVNFDKIIESCSNGNSDNALSYFENIYDNQGSTIMLIRMFVNHFKLVEKILLVMQSGNNLVHLVDNIRPPIFFIQTVIRLKANALPIKAPKP